MVSQPVMGLLELLWHFSLSWPGLRLCCYRQLAIIQQTRSVSSVNTAVYGVSWVHKKSGYQEP